MIKRKNKSRANNNSSACTEERSSCEARTAVSLFGGHHAFSVHKPVCLPQYVIAKRITHRINPFGTISLTTAIFFLLDSPVLVELFYMGQPPYSPILQYTVYIPQVVYAYFVSNRGC